jgi:hypothetical protein
MKKILILFILTACENPIPTESNNSRQSQWIEPCHDSAVLLATTSGSPNAFECPNQLHRMRVQVVTSPSKEEAAALVFCECNHDAK